MRPVGLAVLAACAVLMLTGCRATLSIDLAVDTDGAGTLSVTLVADDELAAHLDEADAHVFAHLAEVGDQTGSWRVHQEPADNPSRVTLTGQFADPEEFAQLTDELTDALDAPEVTLLEDVTLEVTNEDIAVAGIASTVPQEAVAEFGLQPQQAVEFVSDEDAFAYDISVEFPAEVIAADGTVDAETDTVQWNVPVGERLEFRAVSERPQLPLQLIAAGGVMVVALGLLVFGRRRRRPRGRHARAA